ncbi:MAG TPA: YoaK family protein [Candidatus Acidoferrum sp.]|nr:YoaK family protein [Candidatus Acidoferrum sp.]
MEGAAARDAGWPNAGQSDLHEGEVGTIASPLAERLECVIRTRASGLIAAVSATQNERAPEQRPQHAFDWLLVAVLSMTAGAVDLIGFLAFGGLFTAHVTGNIVILAAHSITGGFSRIGPLIAVPVFIVVLGTVVWLFEDKPKHQTLRVLLILHAALLTGFFAVSAAFGPFANPGGAAAASVGMLAVAAMATQNALVKLDLPGFPTTAVLTTNTVQLTIELTTLVRSDTLPEKMALARRRIRMTLPAFAGFIAGCVTGGLLEVHFGLRGLAFPAVLAVLAIPLSEYTVRTVLTTKANFDCAVSTADAKATVDNFV